MFEKKFAKVYVIGDVGGWTHTFENALTLIGVEDYIVPDDTLVIQMGDVVRAGYQYLDSNHDCISISKKLIEKNPDNYIQLYGNHEVLGILPDIDAHMTMERFNGSFKPETLDIMHEVFDSVPQVVEFGIGDKKYYATHAGLTHGFVKKMGCVDNLSGLLDLNSFVDDVNVLKKIVEPSLLRTDKACMSADYYYSECMKEMIPSWRDSELPYQIVGHSSPYQWWRDGYRSDATQDLIVKMKLDNDSRSCWLEDRVLFSDPIWRDDKNNLQLNTVIPMIENVVVKY